MTLQKEYTEILEYLGNKSGNPNVVFEAHYWGQFRLLPNPTDLFPDPDGLLLLAQIQSPPYDTWILLDQEAQSLQLRTGDTGDLQYLGKALTEFLGSREFWQQQLDQEQESYYFDQRKKLAELIPDDAYLVSDIDDPEYFEELEGYFQLLSLLQKLAGEALHFEKISGKTVGQQKHLYLRGSEKQWTIVLTLELFDNGFLEQINALLKDRGVHHYQLFTTINEAMKMVFLKLDGEQEKMLRRMGLLI